MSNITLSINDRSITCAPGVSILNAAEQAGIKIPRLCHHPELKPYGACRICLVEETVSGRIVASCVTPVQKGMVIQTDSETVLKHRRNIVRLMMAEHPESCIVCSKGNRCELRNIAAALGVGRTGLYPMNNYKPLEEANPFLVRDLSKCILCGKCIRADHNLVVTGAIDYNHRGFRSRPTAVHGLPLENSSCTFCGTCISICPTGALTPKRGKFIGTPAEESDSICGFCPVGCSLTMGVDHGKVVEVEPSKSPGSVNGATLCVRGHFAHDFLNVDKRLTCPMLKEGEEVVEADWDTAITKAAEGLSGLAKTYGPQSIGFIGSSKCTNEENYLFQKIARTLIRTNNVDNGSSLWGRSALQNMQQRTDGGARVNLLSNLEKFDAVFVLGGDPCQKTPVAGYYIKRLARKGGTVIVADPLASEVGRFASLRLDIAPNSELALLNGIARLIHDKKGQDPSFVYRVTDGYDRFQEGLSQVDLDKVLEMTQVPLSAMEKAADLLSEKKVAIVVGEVAYGQQQGPAIMDALLNLSLMTGSLGHAGEGGIHIIGSANNQAGAWDMGAVPESLPGRSLLSDHAALEKWGRVWGKDLSPDKGLSIERMVEEAEKGNLKGIYVMGENPLRSFPQPERVKKAFEKLEMIVVQDILEGETTSIAHVVLPGAAFSEKSGSFTNMEGRIQCFKAAVPPPGEAKSDLAVLALVAEKLAEKEMDLSLEKVRDEIAKHLPLYREIEKGGLLKETSKKSLFDAYGERDLISFAGVTHQNGKVDEEEFPFVAIIDSKRSHLGSGTRTGASMSISEYGLKGDINISEEDGLALSLATGDQVTVFSPYGDLTREVAIEKGVKPGRIFIPKAFNNNDALNLLGLFDREKEGPAERSSCRVSIAKKAE